MKINRANQRLNEITPNTLIVGVDIAKKKHWARFVDYRGIELGKAVGFTNDINGFTTIVSEINKICNSKFSNYHIDKIIVGTVLQRMIKRMLSQLQDWLKTVDSLNHIFRQVYMVN